MNRLCTKCKKLKLPEEFYKDQAPPCKACRRKYAAEKREAVKADPELLQKRREYARVYYKNERDENREEYNAYIREWRKQSPTWRELHRLHSRKRTIIKQQSRYATEQKLQELKRRAVEDGYCPLCTKMTFRWHLDHALPLSRGGTHTVGNVYYCCPECNLRKGTKTLEEYCGLKIDQLPIHF